MKGLWGVWVFHLFPIIRRIVGIGIRCISTVRVKYLEGPLLQRSMLARSYVVGPSLMDQKVLTLDDFKFMTFSSGLTMNEIMSLQIK